MNLSAAPRVSANRSACPCGGLSSGGGLSGGTRGAPLSFAACCARLIEQGQAPASAVELMRSRYTAYVLGNGCYLRDTWDPRTCPADLELGGDPAAAPRWLGLEVKAHREFGPGLAEVEFVARYKVAGRAHRLHELSRFERAEDGRWRYRDGTQLPRKP